MFDINEKIMQVKGAIIDFNIWQRNRLNDKIKKQEKKLDRKNEHIDCLIEKWLNGWSKTLNREGYRTKDNELIDLKKIIAESE